VKDGENERGRGREGVGEREGWTRKEGGIGREGDKGRGQRHVESVIGVKEAGNEGNDRERVVASAGEGASSTGSMR
jgi:hypothetical protein